MNPLPYLILGYLAYQEVKPYVTVAAKVAPYAAAAYAGYRYGRRKA